MKSLLAAVLLAVPVQEPAKGPNVIVILADDLGWGDLGCFGSSRFKTPRIDRMAREGSRLTDFYVPVPYCAPSRCALLTGRHPLRSGFTRNPFPKEDLGGVRGEDETGLAEAERTLGEAFRGAGYRTAHVGKWHLGHQPRFYPTRHGFDEYFGILYSNDMHPVALFDGEEKVEAPAVQATLTKRYTERALKFVRENRERPFFLYLAHTMPHKPLAVSDEFAGKSGAGLYGDVLAELDASVGRVLDLVKELGLDERTLIWFTSDNGPWYGGSAGGLRGMKSTAWEGGLRVPLIARWPEKIPAGRVSGEPGAIMDLFTTSLKAAGVAVPDDRVLDGRDLMPVLTSDAKSPHEAIIGMTGADLACVRSGSWKLHLATPRDRTPKAEGWIDPRGPDGVRILAPREQFGPADYPGLRTGDAPRGPSLFDLAADPGEQRDVAASHPEVVERLKGVADRFRADAKSKR